MSIQPEAILATKLTTVFPAAQVGPAGTHVYNASGDPVAPYVLYRRTSTEIHRDFANNLTSQVVDFDVSVASMFYNSVTVVMPDNWIDNTTGTTWYFALSGQYADADNFEFVFQYQAAASF